MSCTDGSLSGASDPLEGRSEMNASPDPGCLAVSVCFLILLVLGLPDIQRFYGGVYKIS